VEVQVLPIGRSPDQKAFRSINLSSQSVRGNLFQLDEKWVGSAQNQDLIEFSSQNNPI
jgi:hypothetical protein